MGKERGQILVGVLILMLVLALIVPAMVQYLQNEAKWSVKQGQNSNAFQLAEAAVDRAYQKLTESTGTWKGLQLTGNSIPNFRFDRSYTDLPGGSYIIAISSGPDVESATVIGIGRDKYEKEVRALKAVFVNSVLGGAAIDAAGGVTMTGSNVDVEWGSVMSPRFISIGAKLHPAYYSASGIDKDTDGPGGINCDQPNCWWWKSYYAGVPPTPFIDFMSYQSSAAASGNTGCTDAKTKLTVAYYTNGSLSGSCTDLTGKTFYVTGNWDNFDGKIVGSVIVLGNLSYQNGALTTLTQYAATVPKTAWKNYCNEWAAYQAYDANAAGQPACFGSINSTYQASGVTYKISPTVRGFMYVGGNLSLPNGGGNDGIIHGAMVVMGSADVNTNAHGRIYYDDNVAAQVMVTRIVLTRQSWQDLVLPWPSGL
ncbi:MAG: hypothetical protein HY926_04575 [Elusimicrobia bacterium]|nr:hypothetical protein [Elusimicrobiota bacterium]